ncbi:isochorismate synthase [Acinetobacter courvalinii]|uniref:isochorismate synthase n=1 Tax=Acinetobacter courvalinii TaxID=280147 RepID=UPI0021CF5E6F|nr:isochorismate synthase [Acinetobacter courvalinii]MCU4367459.1 isochorismate synthase [Acinetobacter courvalinii]MCU4445665.1 isochorismate synthase [Acinetobacter courvalinii]
MMQTQVSEPQNLDHDGPNKFSCFSTKNYHLEVNDFVKTINTPAADTALFNEEIAQCFAEIKAQGHQNPVLIGALPFDITKKSSLNFYADYKKITQPSLTDHVLKNMNNIEVIHKSLLIQRQKFEGAVQLALDAFEKKQVEKVVLSQAVEYEFNHRQQPQNLLAALLKQNPNAYNFVIPVEHHNYILGASPELLLSKQGRLVMSNPLAGSRPKSRISEKNRVSQQELHHSEKDQNEHRIVVENIIKNLATYCVELKVSEFPDILETSTMLHLSSEFQGVLKQRAPDALNLALELHPTPAVCGAPTDVAKQFILDHEGYDRQYYTGLVGWMDAEGNGEWVVTIRCGLLSENKMRLYAGAGIVAGSDAESEWLETEAKMQTMLNIFNSSSAV